MKSVSLSLGIFLLTVFTSVSFYDISFDSIEGATIHTSDYKGKKVVIAVVSADTTNRVLISYLDSVEKANDDVRVIAIPTGDFSGDISMQRLKTLEKNLSIVFAKPLKVTKSNGSLQDPLFKWLTQSVQNQHFNMDVSGEGQVFVVSAKGTLYSVLSKGAPLKIISKVINQDFNE